MTNLREKMKQEMILRGFSLGTQKSYLQAVIKLYKHFNRNPAQLSEEEVKSFLFITLSKGMAASTYNIILYGLKFFYTVVVNKKTLALQLPRHKEPQKLPDILSRVEVEQIIKVTYNLKHRALLLCIYGAGLRAQEAVSLQVRDIDSQRGVIHIREGKGGKDRYVSLSPLMLEALRLYWKYCRLKVTTFPYAGRGL